MYNTYEFESLRKEYVQGALERCAFLQEEVRRLRAGADVDLKQLRQELHKVRGSGGFYGFAALSAASGAAEDQLILTLQEDIDRDDGRIADLVDLVSAAAQSAAREIGM